VCDRPEHVGNVARFAQVEIVDFTCLLIDLVLLKTTDAQQAEILRRCREPKL